MKNPFRQFKKLEWGLWLLSLAVILIASLLSPAFELLSTIASLIGVTALIFVAKGMVIGQILTVVFALFYGYISFQFRYFGELITYLFMTAPIAVMATVTWIRHPYRDSAQVTVGRLSRRAVLVLWSLTAAVTAIFYFILGALSNANLIISTVSVTTSFLAVSLTYLRSPYYALAYAANDVVLIVLWVLASLADPAYISMIVCFFVFLLNDLYGFVNWRRMRQRQQKE